MAASSGRKKTTAATNGQPRDAGGQVQLMMDLDFLKGLIEAVDGSGIDTLEINRAGTRIRISKTPTATVATVPPMVPAPAVALPAAGAAAPAMSSDPASSVPEAPAADEPAVSNLTDITSPMVGTFYRAPAPEAPAYVEIGSTVHKGQTLCILEAMKLMNELESEVDGVVRQILVENGDPVEYGQVLFRIEPA